MAFAAAAAALQTIIASQNATQPTVVPTSIAQTWTTTHTFTGNGTKQTEIFSVPDDWKILYTCVSQGSIEGALGVEVYGADNSIIDVAVNVTCKPGVAKTTGETEEHQAGQIFLKVLSTGDWMIQIQELI